tara:strand:- start:9100 stop:10221 length:1122 start_codon:yes stop_codon:yes gene_type:complete
MNIHLYHSPIIYETRILKITNFLLKHFNDEIYIIGRYEKGLIKKEKLKEKLYTFRIETFLKPAGKISKLLAFIEWNFKVLIFCLKLKKISKLNVHSLSVFPISIIISKLKRARLIYEPHELETETSRLKNFEKKILKFLEKKLIHHADVIYTVGEDITNFYKNEYSLKDVKTILNVPRYLKARERNNILKEKLKIPDENILFIYQGLLSEARGIKTLINCFKKIDDSKHIVFMGFGPLENEIIDAAKENINIHFFPPVTEKDILGYSSSADVGICYLTDLCLSYKLSLPNKIFEYLHAGIPVLINEEQLSAKKLIEKESCGFILSNNPTIMRNQINDITRNQISKELKNLPAILEKYNWEKQEANLLKIYSNI